MIDKNDPEIQAYLKEELQKQKEQINGTDSVEKCQITAWCPTYADMEYYNWPFQSGN